MTNPTTPPPATPSTTGPVGATGEENRPESAGNPPQPAPEPQDESAADAADAQSEVAGADAVADAEADTDADADAGDGGDADGDAGADESTDAGAASAAAGAGADEAHLGPGQTSVPVGDEVVVDDATMRRALEAILMVTDEPLPVLTLARAVGRPTGDVGNALAELAAEYTEQGRGFDLREVGGGWRYYTRAEAATYVERFVLDGQQARLTQAALETLAVVAYKQPVSRARVSAIRGVNVDGVMRTLVARGLVEEAGSDTESQATLYRTSTYFLERMGMQSLDDLPELAPYLPEMDDIEEELAAQSLPPAPANTDAEPSADEQEGTSAAEDAGDETAGVDDLTQDEGVEDEIEESDASAEELADAEDVEPGDEADGGESAVGDVGDGRADELTSDAGGFEGGARDGG